MTTQDHIDKVCQMVWNALDPKMDGEKKEKVLWAVQDLGYQWQQANAHCKALCICAGMARRPEDEEFDPENEKQLRALEDEGSTALMKEMGLPMYAGLVTELTMSACTGKGRDFAQPDRKGSNPE